MTTAPNLSGVRLIKFPDLASRFGLTWSRQHVGRLVRDGKFPKPIKLGDRSIFWIEQQIVDYIAAAAAKAAT